MYLTEGSPIALMQIVRILLVSRTSAEYTKRTPTTTIPHRLHRLITSSTEYIMLILRLGIERTI